MEITTTTISPIPLFFVQFEKNGDSLHEINFCILLFGKNIILKKPFFLPRCESSEKEMTARDNYSFRYHDLRLVYPSLSCATSEKSQTMNKSPKWFFKGIFYIVQGTYSAIVLCSE